MKPILRDLRTGLYFQGGANWTQYPEEALIYRDLESALEAARASLMATLELNILLFDDPRYTLRLSLHELFHEPNSSRKRILPPRDSSFWLGWVRARSRSSKLNLKMQGLEQVSASRLAQLGAAGQVR